MKISAQKIMEVFNHRKDVFAQQQPKGIYLPQRRPVTIEDIEKHLKGEITIGFYCLNTDNTVKWACIDLDGTDLRQLDADSKVMYNAFPEFNRMREFSGRRGYHVWIFFKKPVPASYAQQLIKSRLNRLGMNNHEIFPKQTELNEGRKYGSLVKLPLALHKVSGKFSEILEIEGNIWN